MRPGGNLSFTVTLPNEQRIEIPEAVVRWSRGQDFAVENLAMKPLARARLQHYVKRLADGMLSDMTLPLQGCDEIHRDF